MKGPPSKLAAKTPEGGPPDLIGVDASSKK
jgi:hypothetical protein